VTRSTPDIRPPASIDVTLPVPWVQNWYGNDSLWTRLPPTGVVPALGQPGGLQTKYPWWRSQQGDMTFTGHRLDGPSEGFHVDANPSGYGPTGFLPSSVYWPSTGCWQVIGTVAGHSPLMFTMWVQQFPGFH
jgi:hypothetical protein